MSDPGVALLMLGILVFTIMIGFPVAFTLMALGVGFGYYAYFQPHRTFSTTGFSTCSRRTRSRCSTTTRWCRSRCSS